MQKSPWKYYHFTCLPRMAIIWCTFREIRSTTGKIFSHFGPFFALFYWKIKVLKKKNNLGDIISLHLCTTNDNHIMHGSLNIKCNRQSFCGLFFVLLITPLKIWKIKILIKWKKKKKNSWRYYHMYYKYISENVWFLRYVVWQIEFFFSLWPFFALLLP